MRTTIQIDDNLHDLARQHAMAKGKTFTALVEEALREKLLVRKTTPEPKKRVTLKTVGGHGVLPGVELDNNAALLDLMEQKLMLLCDVNILVYAHREDSENHAAYLEWLSDLVNSDETFAVSELVLSGFLRIVTHPKIFSPPSALGDALEFVANLRQQENCKVVVPGERHWEIFQKLCQTSNARGNLIPDAYHAALAIEAGCEWITADRGFGRYEGLRWRCPV